MREESASKAASQLGLTQQAVSEHLKKLRDVFDELLFVRKTNGFIPTPFAERLSVKLIKYYWISIRCYLALSFRQIK